MSYKVEVTAADLKNGMRFGIDNGPLALAIRRALVNVDEVNVYRTTFYVAKQSRGATYTLPPEAAKAVIDFDNGLPVEPFSFTIEAWSFAKV